MAHSRDDGRPSWRPVIGVVLPPLWHQGHKGQFMLRISRGGDPVATPQKRPGTARPAALRARATNDPLHGRASRNTAQGRRIGDLFDAYLRAMGNPADALTQANALAAAELKVATEDARAKLLAGGDIDPDQPRA
jgi:hypothetical protein